MKKFLIANPFGIGDALFSLASAEKIRQNDPRVTIGFIGNERTASLLRLCASVDHVYVFNRDHLNHCWKNSPLTHFKEIKKLTDAVGKERYDALLDFSLGREFSLAAMLMGIRRRIGFDYKGRGIFLTYKKKIAAYEKSPVAQQQMDLLKDAGIFPDNRMPGTISIRVSSGASGRMHGKAPLVSIAPGGCRSWGRDAIYKQWNPERFAEAANRIISLRPGVRIALLGDKDEEFLLQQVKKELRGAECAVLAGESIESVCGVLKQSDMLLCNDGGLLHLAHALGTKSVAIFGPVDERVYGPYGGPAPFRVVTQGVPCRPCYQNFHFPPCSHERQCLTEISVDKVIEAVREIL